MINMTAIVSLNGFAFLLLIILFMNTGKNRRNNFADEKIFRFMIYLNMVQTVIETLSFWIIGKIFTGSIIIATALNSILYINVVVFTFAWVVYLDYRMFGSRERILKIYTKIAIPSLLIVIASIVNLFVPIFFEVTPENLYERTSYFFLSYLVSYANILYGTVLVYKYRRKIGKYLFIPVVIFLVPVILSSILQYVFYGMSLIWAGSAIALTSMYINIQNEASFTDSLSGLFTRQHMTNYLDSKIKSADKDKTIAGIMIDIDKFKSINDNFGHLVGDDAIINTARILHTSVATSGIAARYAGDEFVIILVTEKKNDINDTIDKIKFSTEQFNNFSGKQYKLSFSVGCTVFDREKDTIETFVKRMDDVMYAEKRHKKENTPFSVGKADVTDKSSGC